MSEHTPFRDVLAFFFGIILPNLVEK
jgi:5-methylcytosine-specific restriction endonuclease McrBC regulatory subunit McrC